MILNLTVPWTGFKGMRRMSSFFLTWIWRQSVKNCFSHLFVVFTASCSANKSWEILIHSSGNEPWQTEWEDPECCPQNLFPNSSLSCKTPLIPPLFFSPAINFHAKIIKRKYFSSAPWKRPCHWLETVWDVKNPTGDRIFFPFGTHLVPTVTLLLEDYFDVFFGRKYAPAVVTAYIAQYVYS